MARMGLLIDIDYCCGCHTCEIACQKEHGYGVETWGVKCEQVGPHIYEEQGVVVYDIVPIPTKLCDLCGERVSQGKLPTCVKHCQTQCMKFGPVEELAKELEAKPRQVLFAPK